MSPCFFNGKNILAIPGYAISFNTNALPIETLAKSLPKFTLAKHKNNPLQIEAMIFESSILEGYRDKRCSRCKKIIRRKDVNPNWENHYRFDVLSKPESKSLGQSSIDILLLNTFVLFLFSYGKRNQEEYFINRSLKLLEKLPAE